DNAAKMAKRLISEIQKPIATGPFIVEVGASVGIARYPSDGSNAETLIRRADMAMYRAKQSGRGSFRFFEPKMDSATRSQAALQIDLRRAVGDRDIEPYYQPIFKLADKKLYEFEVLARWRHPVKGYIAPDTFIPMAEKL